MTLLESLKNHDPGKVALCDARQSISYGNLPAAITTKAKELAGITCAALAMDNCVDWVLWDLAAVESGTVLVPIPPFFTKEQTEHALKSAGCAALITDQGVRPLSFTPVEFPAQTSKITFTSGTTGAPKGVPLSHMAMEQVAQSIVEVLGPELTQVHCCILPLAVLLENVAGVYAALFAGCTIHLPALAEFGENYSQLHRVLKDTKASSVILVPEILRALMAQVSRRGSLPDLRFAAVGGAKVSVGLVAQARKLGLPVYEGYGLSECASVVSLNTPGNDRPGTSGKLLPHATAAIENGEIVVNGFRTGDLGTIDDDGFLTVTGRKKNVLITSYGRNVSPEWPESALLAQPEIAQAIVYGDGQAQLSALVVPASRAADIAAAVARANAALPDYARIGNFETVAPFSAQDGTLTGNGRPRRAIILQRQGKEMTMTFYEKLVKETQDARQELYTVPQLADGLKGEISRETYIAYLTQAYHHVRHTVRFLMAMGARLPESRKWLHDAIAEYIDEEKGHEEWILNDIEAAGGNKEAARNATPNLQTQVLVAYNYDYIARKNPVGFLGMVFMLESTSTQVATVGADAIKTGLGLPQNAFTYLYSHGSLDIKHMQFFEQLVNKIDDQEDQAAIIEVARNTFRLFADVLRSIPHERKARHAA